MTITEKYISKILPYLDEEIETEIINGLVSYKFACPWCSMFCRAKKTSKQKCASLTPIKGSFDYKFVCKRSGCPECRRRYGGRSFYNFLLMLNPSLHHQYKKELATLCAYKIPGDFYFRK